MKKKKHTGVVFLVVLLIILAIAAVVFCKIFPVWKDAGIISSELDFQHTAFELKLDLNQEAFSENGSQLLEAYAKLMDLEEDSLHKLTLKGETDGAIIHTFVYPDGVEEPVLEFYLSDEIDVINGAMIYNSFHDNLVKKSPLVGYLLPVWEENEYVTLEQLEQLFDLEFKEAKEFDAGAFPDTIPEKYLFGIMMALSKEKENGNRLYTYRGEDIDLSLVIGEDKSLVNLELSVEHPQQAMDDLRAKSEKYNIDLNMQADFENFEKVEIKLNPAGSCNLEVPTDQINQTMVDVIAGLRSLIGD